ncbi:hypothetical protein HW555_007137 [Spodoptera exigua]|uniref:Uncharacterized protein n=1 Tax=Spodoptera exigua TaxID=7107 RepID=A0A835L5N6_SPOEX|nr:hypothetical protein HW555_007137 [Spodoptera exigua]
MGADGIVQPDAYHPPMEVERSKCHDDYKTYSNLRNTLKSRVESAYRSYITRVESNIKLNPREFWRHISSLRSKGGFEPQVNFRGESFTGAAAAEAFAKFFASVFLTDVPRLNADSVNSFDVNHNSNYVNIFHITSEDVINGINKLKTSGSIGPDSTGRQKNPHRRFGRGNENNIRRQKSVLLPGAGRMLKPYDEKICRAPGDKLYGSSVEQLGVSSSPMLRSSVTRAT